ncbi:hypothetical protein DY000_02022130 [Brassica cretica]|uniref:SMP domain-containing protein n=1 Tax=Brassica cretica TaxID=69181 RepID=A0ABQ7E7G4_BRACR|nr:hypothetical protein DY000_02022130 [Brassica cretica]
MISDVSPDPSGSPVRVREGKDRVEEGSAIGESGPFVGKTGVLSYEAERVLIEEDKEAERVLAASQQHELRVAEGAGKTPEKLANANQNEDFPITASKFAVLSVEEEEDGEIMDDRRLVTDTVETAVNECDVVKSGDDAEGDSTVATIIAGVAGPNQVTAAEREGEEG